jgi:hypothetical protein
VTRRDVVVKAIRLSNMTIAFAEMAFAAQRQHARIPRNRAMLNELPETPLW